jgi:hypothetical protein
LIDYSVCVCVCVVLHINRFFFSKKFVVLFFLSTMDSNSILVYNILFVFFSTVACEGFVKAGIHCLIEQGVTS